jgi:hypothetical protein
VRAAHVSPAPQTACLPPACLPACLRPAGRPLRGPCCPCPNPTAPACPCPNPGIHRYLRWREAVLCALLLHLCMYRAWAVRRLLGEVGQQGAAMLAVPLGGLVWLALTMVLCQVRSQCGWMGGRADGAYFVCVCVAAAVGTASAALPSRPHTQLRSAPAALRAHATWPAAAAAALRRCAHACRLRCSCCCCW